MSRRIPPTPVAAPWFGSPALGWLWDSILNATARPPPLETPPEFSPRPPPTPPADGPVGSVARSGLELLYEQCSLHITLNMASSTWFGSRPPRPSRTAASSATGPPRGAPGGAPR